MSVSVQKVYNKADSFVNLDYYSEGNHLDTYVVNHLKNQLVSVDKHKKYILERVIYDLEKGTDFKCKSSFKLLNHVKEEIIRINPEKLSDYIYYRYRYDVFPNSKEVDTYPPLLQIEPTSMCNYRCVFCFQTDEKLTKNSNNHMGHMSFELFKRIIDEIEGNVQGVTLASRGEPLINKYICEMLEYMKGKFLATKINTNGSLLTDKTIRSLLSSEINTIVFSADAASEALYSKLRVNGNLNKVLNNVRRFNEIKEKEFPNNRSITRVSGVYYDKNQNIEEMQNVWGGLVDQIAFVKYCPWSNIYQKSANNIKTPCSDLWRRMFVWWDGRCNPCDADYLTTLKIGKFPKNSIKEIWNGDIYKDIRELHCNSKRQKKNVCSKCSVI
jgi:organic radical activating enzyme